MKKINKLTYISLFSSAGVGCYGISKNGFSCMATAELNERRINVQKANNKCKYSDGYICGDITQNDVKDRLLDAVESYKKKEKIKDLDLLVATPPCQGMSVANHKKKDELSRNSLIVESLRLTSELKPKFFIYENVSSFLKAICTDLDGINKSIFQAIENNLASEYLLSYDVVNFKNYGSLSSRTRTLVIGVRKDLKETTPLEIFPDYKKEKTLEQVIGKMNSLQTMGEIDPDDIYHNFRPYRENMREWIRDLKEGESAFDNKDDSKKPHQIIDGEMVINQNKNGDKYKRQIWENVAPCIHTRNDIMASQNTVHPTDDRVFSIRELMRLMTIPDSFRWVSTPETELNSLSDIDKRAFLKKNEMNIRQCIGEAVPTTIFSQISIKIKNILENRTVLSDKEVNELIVKHELLINGNLSSFLDENLNTFNMHSLFKIAELANSKKNDNAAFYTRQDICYSLIKDLPTFSKQDSIYILEPSVGVGSFIPLLIKKYHEKKNITIDVVDIDPESIKILKILMKKVIFPKNVKINYITSDFLLNDFDKKYDVAIGNPPYKKVTNNRQLLLAYKKNVKNSKTNNLFSFFIEKCMGLAYCTALIVPKSLVNSPEYSITKSMLAAKKIVKINDYNEKAFNVKIETLGFIIEDKKVPKNHMVEIESYLRKKTFFQEQNYIISEQFDTWLLYRNDFFDSICKKMEFDIFDAYRDRQITKKHLKKDGEIRVLKSRNIVSNGIVDISEYDRYLDNIKSFSAFKFLNKKNIVLIPNLTYNPRASFLPSGCIADGSVAMLTVKDGITRQINEKDLEYFGSEEFRNFYKVARNYGTRSLNIDNNSVKFFGVLNAVNQY